MISENDTVDDSDPPQEVENSPPREDTETPNMGSMFNYEEILFTAFNELDLPSGQVNHRSWQPEVFCGN